MKWRVSIKSEPYAVFKLETDAKVYAETRSRGDSIVYLFQERMRRASGRGFEWICRSKFYRGAVHSPTFDPARLAEVAENSARLAAERRPTGADLAEASLNGGSRG